MSAGTRLGLRPEDISARTRIQSCNGPAGEYLTDRLTDEALKFIETNRNSPFFLYMTHYAVHTPIQAKADSIAKYEGKPPSNGQNNPTYAAMIDSVTQGIARVMVKFDGLNCEARPV